MPISLPDNPTDGQTVQIGTIIYTYDATVGVWNSNSAVGPTLTPATTSIDVLADITALIAKTGMSNGDQAFVTGNNNLYIYSGTGWYKIATVQNDSPSAITGVSGTYELARDGTPTVITAVSTDPEGFPLTWTYSTSGLGSIATVSQADNVFTVTPSTDEANIGTFTLTINATDGVNGAVNTGTSLSLIFNTSNSKYTTLLATATGTSDNNNITDASTNSHTITVNGDAHAGTFSPYRSGGYSTYFGGSSLISAATPAAIGTQDYTIEFWMNSPNVTSTWQSLVSRDYNNSDGFRLYKKDSTSELAFYSGGISVRATTSGAGLTNNVWHHIAVVRNSGTLQIYVDGVSKVSTSNSDDISEAAAPINIGGNTGEVSNYPFTGYIRDMRVVNGTAVYTSNFTPPTEPLTAITNTTLLTCHLPYIADGSTNAHAITAGGNVSTKPLSPYDYSEYSAIAHGGSLYFDGNGDAIEIADNDDFDFGTGDLTIECWVYPEVTGNNYPGFLGTTAGWGSVAASGMRFDNLGDSKFQMSWYGPGDPFLETQSTYLHDQWYHFVVTRTGGNTWRMFINGILEDVATNSTPYDICVGGHNLQVGGKTWDGGNGWFKGNVDDLRLTKGSVVTEYQTSSTTTGTKIFTPRTTPITSSGSELHIKGTDASIIDKSQGSNLTLVGNTTGSTTQVKFADTKSIYLDSSVNAVSFTPGYDDPSFNFGTGDWTIELWAYIQTLSGGRNLFSFLRAGTTETVPHFYTSNTDLRYYVNGTDVISSTNVLTLNTWHHITLTRNGNDHKIFVDGTQVGSTWTSAQTYVQGRPVLGDYYISLNNLNSSTNTLHGYVQDFRITKGLARYTANFTPPTAPLKG
jgi:hypothetical protein